MMNAPSLPSYVTDEFLRGLHFRSGKGTGKEGDRCSIQEYRAWWGLDPASDDVPKTDSEVVGRYIIGFQDRVILAGATPEQVYELVGRHLPKLHMSGRGKKLEEHRSFLLLDMMVRELAPLWLELTPELAPFAEQLRALSPITDRKSNESAQPLYDAARSAAWAVRSKSYRELEAKVKESFLKAKPEGLRDQDWAAVAEAAEAAVAAAAEAAVAAEAAAAVAAAVEAAAAVDLIRKHPRRDGESDSSYSYRLRYEVPDGLYYTIRNAVRPKVLEALLAQHRERIERSWAIGGRFIEQALAMRDESEAA